MAADMDPVAGVSAPHPPALFLHPALLLLLRPLFFWWLPVPSFVFFSYLLPFLLSFSPWESPLSGASTAGNFVLFEANNLSFPIFHTHMYSRVEPQSMCVYCNVYIYVRKTVHEIVLVYWSRSICAVTAQRCTWIWNSHVFILGQRMV